MRISDSDRQRTVDELRRHCAAGRIDVDDYARRVEQALTASTLEELDRLRADLPMLRIADPSREPAGAADGRAGAGPAAVPDVAGRVGDGGGPPGPGVRLPAVAFALVGVVVVLAALGLAVAAQWGWAVALVVGYAVGLVQGRFGRGGR